MRSPKPHSTCSISRSQTQSHKRNLAENSSPTSMQMYSLTNCSESAIPFADSEQLVNEYICIDVGDEFSARFRLCDCVCERDIEHVECGFGERIFARRRQ